MEGYVFCFPVSPVYIALAGRLFGFFMAVAGIVNSLGERGGVRVRVAVYEIKYE